MLVGENTDAFPASKATTSETNLSTSSRPRPAPSGGNYIDGVYARKRRHVPIINPPHAFVLSDVTTNTGSPSTSEHDTYSEHAGTDASVSSSSPLHDVVNAADEFPLTKGAAITNSTSTTEDIIDATTSITEKVQFISTENNVSTYGPSTESSSEDSIENSSSTLEASSSPFPMTKEPDVIKIDKDDEVPPEVPSNQSQKHESNSMKPSDVESPDAIQHDYPVYSYGQDEVEIVKLNHDTLSTTMKSKSSYNHDKSLKDSEVEEPFDEAEKRNFSDSSDELTDHNLSAAKDGTFKLHLNKPVFKMHEGSENNTTNSSFVSETNKQSKISIIEVPPVHSETAGSKRILVNVTIATDPDSSNPFASQSVYVLSVSVPTDGDPSHTPDVNVNSKMHHNVSSHSMNPITVEEAHATEKPSGHWGSECQCSCPCLDDKPNFSDIFSQDYDYETDKDPSLLQNITFTTLVDLAKRNATDIISSTTESSMDMLDSTQSTTETQETWKTETQCPEITTQLPPTPTILILEGRSVSISKNRAINIAKAFSVGDKRNMFLF